eukprot:gene8863-8952_t
MPQFDVRADFSDPAFLGGGGEMGALMREHDWAATPLGPPGTWPQSLRTVIRLLLNTRHPMFVFWGPEHICFYNDAYSLSIGPERHPVALGRPGREVWSEIWHVIGPQIDLVMSGGGATWHENQLLPITRHGRVEDVYWTYSYSPIDDEDAETGVGGVLVVVTETTAQVLVGKRQASEAAARTAERDRLAQMFAQAPGFMTLLRGPNHIFEFANDAYMRVVGRRELIGRTVAEVLPEAAEQGFVALLDEVYRTGEAFSSKGARFALRNEQDGTIDERFLDFVYQPMLDTDGAITGIFVEGSDTTDRTRAEMALEAANRELRHSEEEFRALGDNQPSLSWMARPDGYIFWYNKRWYDYTGTTLEQMQGSGWRSVHDPEALPSVLAQWDTAISTGESMEMIFPLRGADGQFRQFLTRMVPVRDDDGRITRWFGNNFDISAQLEAEAALRASEARFRVLADSMPQMVWSTTADGTNDYFNARWYEFTGVSEATTAGESWISVFHPDDQARSMEAWRRSVATGEMFEVEYRLRRRDGVYRWTLGRALPLHDADGQIVRWFGTCTDIDDTKQAAEVLARGRAELERLVEARTAALLREMDERRKAEEALRQGEKLQAIGQLTGGIAHDFNNILQVVMSGATLLGRPNLPEKRRLAVLDGMTGAAQSAKELTGRLLAFARKQSLRPEPFDLNARLSGMSELLRHTLGSLIAVETSFAEDLWWAVADVSQLEVAILNLAMNARDAMLPKGGVLRFETRNATLPAAADRSAGEFVSMIVRDSGMGMPPSSGGDIAIESVPGEGTTITLHLPRAPVGRSGGIGAAPAPHSQHPITQSAGRCVLVVDDNADVAAFAVSMLEELGYSARCVGNANEALAVLQTGVQVDVVFTDVVMPGDMNGMQSGW